MKRGGGCEARVGLPALVSGAQVRFLEELNPEPSTLTSLILKP